MTATTVAPSAYLLPRLERYPEGPLDRVGIPDGDSFFHLADISDPFDWECDGGVLWLPTNRELEEISRFVWWQLASFYERYAVKVLANDLRETPAHSFYKYGVAKWRYKVPTWQHGPRPLEYARLGELFEQIISIGPVEQCGGVAAWRLFCERHPLPCES